MKPSIRPPAKEDWERMRKYFGYVREDGSKYLQAFYTAWCITTFFSSTETIQVSKSPINLHRINEADAIEYIFFDTPTIDGGETSAYFFFGHDSKITDVYKVKIIMERNS